VIHGSIVRMGDGHGRRLADHFEAVFVGLRDLSIELSRKVEA
jgi:hypothetical protein